MALSAPVLASVARSVALQCPSAPVPHLNRTRRSKFEGPEATSRFKKHLTSEIKGVSAGHTGSRWCQVVLRANWGKKSTSAQHLSAQCRWICGTAVPSAGPVSLNLWHCSAPVPASVARSVALQCPVSRRAGRPAVPAPGRVALSASWIHTYNTVNSHLLTVNSHL